MKAPPWQYFIPRYGNFGGPGWSGGVMMADYSEVDWAVKPVDSLDELFCRHDKHYQAAIHKERDGIITELEKYKLWLKADKELIQEIDDLPIDPHKWPRKPSNMFYGWLYRKLAIYSFTLKTWVCERVRNLTEIGRAHV